MQIEQILNHLTPDKKALLIGSAFVDLGIKLEKLPQSGSDQHGQFENAKVGGCCFNVADVLYKLNLPFQSLMPLGEGFIANLVKEEFKKRNYPLHCFKGFDNGWCLSLVEANGERSFITMDGIERQFQKSWFKDLKLKDFDFVYLSGYQMEGENAKVILDALEDLKETCTIVYDPGPRIPLISQDITAELEKRHCLYTINLEEAFMLTGKASAQDALGALHLRTKQSVVVTAGKNGAYIEDDLGFRHIEGFKIKVVDTVGSGDSHTGGIIAGLMCNLTLDDATLLANRLAASVTATQGAASAQTLRQLLDDPMALKLLGK